MKISDVWLGSKTNRYHTDPLLNRVVQTNADHSWGVAAIVCYLVDKPSSNLLKACIFHDGAEFIVGDFPNPFKRLYPQIKAQHKKAEEIEMSKLGICSDITEDEYRLLKLADSLDAIAFVKLHQPDYLKYRDDWKSHLTSTLHSAESISQEIFKRTLVFLRGINPQTYKSGRD